MSNLLGFGGRRRLAGEDGPRIEHVMMRRPLQRVLAFTGWSIDDVINDPLVKNEVRGYYKLYRKIERVGEIGELERQWNPLGRRVP